MDRAEKIKAFVEEQHKAGRTVFFATRLVIIKLAPNKAEFFRVRGGHAEVLRGKQGWVSVNYTTITAK